MDSATTARDGLRLARDKRYDAIIIDHRLRDKAGFEVLAALNDLDRNTPKVYVASSSAENVAIRAVERGATGYLLKTANFFELLPLEIEQQITRLRLRLEAERQRDALKASEERYRMLFERARDPVFVVDAEGHFLALNRALGDLTGYEREELLRMNVFDLLIEDYAPIGTGGSVFPSSDEGTLEFGIRKKDGSVAFVEVTTRLVQQGSLVVGVEAIARDVTGKRAIERAFRALEASEANLREVIETVDEGIVRLGPDGTFLAVNPAACRIFGRQEADLLGHSMVEFAARGSEAGIRANLEAVVHAPGRGRRFEADMRTREEVVRPVEVHARVAARSGSPASLIASIRDLSERREFERRLIQSERLASLGELSAYVAHEINTPLTNISLLSAGISRKTQDAEVLEKVQKIDAQRRLASTIISDLLNYSRRPEPALSEMDLRTAVDRALEDVDVYRNPEVKVHRDLGSEPLLIQGDPLQLQEVVGNVVKNAYEVTERGRVEVRAWRQSDGYVVATVEDRGPGISPDDLARVFEPFFTTKRLGKGTGLGLAICRNIMTAHSGQIEVESELGKGTRVTLLFPGRKVG